MGAAVRHSKCNLVLCEMHAEPAILALAAGSHTDAARSLAEGKHHRNAAGGMARHYHGCERYSRYVGFSAVDPTRTPCIRRGDRARIELESNSLFKARPTNTQKCMALAFLAGIISDQCYADGTSSATPRFEKVLCCRPMDPSHSTIAAGVLIRSPQGLPTDHALKALIIATSFHDDW